MLPLVRPHQGELQWVVIERAGQASWVFDPDGAHRTHQVLGATGVPLHHVGEAWHADGLHGSEPDWHTGLVNHGVRHARLDDPRVPDPWRHHAEAVVAASVAYRSTLPCWLLVLGAMARMSPPVGSRRLLRCEHRSIVRPHPWMGWTVGRDCLGVYCGGVT